MPPSWLIVCERLLVLKKNSSDTQLVPDTQFAGLHIKTVVDDPHGGFFIARSPSAMKNADWLPGHSTADEQVAQPLQYIFTLKLSGHIDR
jgi:hypothetical protein